MIFSGLIFNEIQLDSGLYSHLSPYDIRTDHIYETNHDYIHNSLWYCISLNYVPIFKTCLDLRVCIMRVMARVGPRDATETVSEDVSSDLAECILGSKPRLRFCHRFLDLIVPVRSGFTKPSWRS